jgi:hypothetical protein
MNRFNGPGDNGGKAKPAKEKKPKKDPDAGPPSAG